MDILKVSLLIFCTQASELLRDTSLGGNMRVHLVRMIILSEPEVGTFLLPVRMRTHLNARA